MFRRYSVNFELFSILLDVILIFASFPMALIAHPWIENILPFLHPIGLHELPSVYYVLFAVFLLSINATMNLYDGRRNVRIKDEFTRLILCMLFTNLGIAGMLFFTYSDYAHSLLITFSLIAMVLMGFWRILIRLYWRMQYSHQQELRRVLIVGAGDTGQQMAAGILAQPESNLKIIGYLDDDPQKLTQNQDILGATTDLEKIVALHRINIVAIALPASAFGLSSVIVSKLRMTPVKIWIVPNAHRLALYHSAVEYFSNIPLVDIRTSSISENQRLAKRLFDLLLSFLLILISSPVMMIIAVLIKLDSPGPIFFRQKRVGENTQPFEILKFRTMIQNAETFRAGVEKKDEQGNMLHKHRDDPRITRIGSFLRRYSLDELPQLFNVLFGKMSLVGPRPELPHLVQNYNHWQYVRFTLPQGMTGWWQVNGRSNKPMHLNTEDDFYYIENYSIWLDIKILWKTMTAVLKGDGAF